MTTLDDLCTVLTALDIPWVNTAWTRGDDAATADIGDMKPPFIALVRQVGTSAGANDATWCVTAEYDIELYTVKRDYTTEAAIKTALDSAGIFYEDGGVWNIPTEGLIETVYTVTVREN